MHFSMDLIQKYESFLLRNWIISSNFQQISSRSLDRRGRIKVRIAFCLLIAGHILQTFHMIAILPMRQETSKFIRDVTGDYYDVFGFPTLCLSVIFTMVNMTGIMDKMGFWFAEEQQQLAVLTQMPAVPGKMDNWARDQYFRTLSHVLNMEKMGFIAFYYPSIVFHTCLVAYSGYLDRDYWLTIADVIAAVIGLFCMRVLVMVLVASETIFVLVTTEIRLRVESLKKKIRSHLENPVSGNYQFLANVLQEIDEITQTVRIYNKDVKWMIFNSISVLMPAASIGFCAGFLANDRIIQVYVIIVVWSFLSVLIFFISIPSQVHSSMKSVYPLLNSLQARIGTAGTLKRRLLRWIQVIASERQPISFTCGDSIPFARTTIVQMLSIIVNFSLLMMQVYFESKINKIFKQ